ncbi:membrane protein [Collibacillus ludicampi]|uniref:Membrane protein n=1 Tax=Collibacillus ludicampi TaxID=2771369 RepID=A0AAV4LB33_9BACL|nr:putative sulfate exporter family transporter [Collibacillus ludicampi]GIM44919.1 membrane protein [Collibacillus ludicampi]
MRVNVEKEGIRQTVVQRKTAGFSKAWIGGILFTFAIAFVGTCLTKFPVIDRLGPMVTAILIAIIYRQFAGYPEAIRSGINFSAKRMLRFAIILFGFKLNVDTILHQGLGLLARDVGSIAIAILVTMMVAHWIKAEPSLSLMLAVGTGVCGAAAIAAVSPIMEGKDDDTAIGVGLIALVGTLFTIAYTLLEPIVHMTNIQYGIWSGISLHEIAHVAAAAAPAGQDALTIALLAKLGRVLLLVPLCLILAAWMKKKGSSDKQSKIEFPRFLFGFIATSLIGSYVPIPPIIMQNLATASSFLLTAAMVGLGLNVSFKALRTKALKPFIAMLAASVVLSIATYLSIIL